MPGIDSVETILARQKALCTRQLSLGAKVNALVEFAKLVSSESAKVNTEALDLLETIKKRTVLSEKCKVAAKKRKLAKAAAADVDPPEHLQLEDAQFALEDGLLELEDGQLELEDLVKEADDKVKSEVDGKENIHDVSTASSSSS